MTKKSFKGGGLSSLLGEKKELNLENAKEYLQEFNKPGKVKRVITNSSQKGTKENETRATFIVNEELLDKLKAIAYWDRILIKDVVNSGLEEYVANKKVKPRPEDVRLKEQENNQKSITTPGYKARLPKF
jgi:hypothetical protein